MNFNYVSEINAQRARRWHGNFPVCDDGWTGADWSNAMCGEAGETANIVKKLRRLETQIQQAEGLTRDELLDKLRKEIGDTFIYLDLLAQFYGQKTELCVVQAFNETSIREGFPERLDPIGRNQLSTSGSTTTTTFPHTWRVSTFPHTWRVSE